MNGAHHRIQIMRFVAHGARVLRIARRFGWLPAARYTNLRDVRGFERLGFLDIDWRQYSFRQHLLAARATQPFLTVARDLERAGQLLQVLEEGDELARYAEHVIVVPKALALSNILEEVIPKRFLLGYSVPTRYGGTRVPARAFKRPVHLLGGRPDVQRRLAEELAVVSIDCNRFTLDAAYGDYFNGTRFVPHPGGGYERCITDSLRNINRLWRDYGKPTTAVRHSKEVARAAARLD